MSITKYEKNGQIFWKVYLNLRSQKDPTIRLQKKILDIPSEREAKAEERKYIALLSQQIYRLESEGLKWSEIIERWFRQQELFPTRRLSKTTIIDYKALLLNWTIPWLNRPAASLNRADGREILSLAEAAGKSAQFRRRIKYIVNMAFEWGIQERLIIGVPISPVHGLEIDPDRVERRPEILTREQIRELLKKAKQQNHPWYKIWTSAVLTGCRSGELHQLKKEDLEIIDQKQAVEENKKPFHQRRYGFLRVQRSWNVRFKEVGPTKAGYWRNIPVSSEFYWFLVRDLQVETLKLNDFLLPRHWHWNKGEQAKVLKAFCIANGLPQIKFHTLRACFATQLISSGIPATIVMKICGWRDLKTMQRYIRLSGIDEAGATEVLNFVPTEESTMEKVVNLFDWKE